MMDITPLVPKTRKIISAYGEGMFTFNHKETYSANIIALGDSVELWGTGSAREITYDSLRLVVEHTPALEILLIGSGKDMVPLNQEVRLGLREKGIVVDVMSTGAACRTYNVLLAEDRRVAAALIAI